MRPPDRPHGIMCHYFHGAGFPPAQGSISADDFQRGLDAYGDRLIPADIWIEMCLDGTLENQCCVTIDDGLREAYEIAFPVLENWNLTAAWNVYTGPLVGVPNRLEQHRRLRNYGFGSVEAFYQEARKRFAYGYAPPGYLRNRGYLTREDKDFRYWRDHLDPAVYEITMDQLSAVAGSMPIMNERPWISADELKVLAESGHVIGVHTHSHPVNMLALSAEQEALEYATAKFILERFTNGYEIYSMSHPRGIYSRRGIGWLKEHGFVLGWGATMDGVAPWDTPRWSTGYWRD